MGDEMWVLSERLDSCEVVAAIVLPIALVLLEWMDSFLLLGMAYHKNWSMPNLRAYFGYLKRKTVKVLVSLLLIYASTSIYSVLTERLDSCVVAAAIVLPMALVLLPHMDPSLDLSRLFGATINAFGLVIIWLVWYGGNAQASRSDVLRGIGYLHQVENSCHGNLSELNIVIVNGREKITGMVKDVLKKYVDDYLSLATIVRSCFHRERQTIPTELELLLTYISTTKPSEEVDEELNGYWPEFTPILHQVLVDHGYFIVVHDVRGRAGRDLGKVGELMLRKLPGSSPFGSTRSSTATGGAGRSLRVWAVDPSTNPSQREEVPVELKLTGKLKELRHKDYDTLPIQNFKVTSEF
ncbi:hypothetical protein CJ030_MR4G003024 [Morella rubra]|uniref:Uncharacterized protein n=1 Tax=Morella rubra TaxID=262757 RepID=A0A6A1VS20_9ROSI|nr:hypothetical protein CJ030_MR4G003024 [Morella rubra]